MIAALLFLSALVFIPTAVPFVNAHDLPKTALVGALAVAAWIHLYIRASGKGGSRSALTFPLICPIAVFIFLSALSVINAVNIHYFFYSLGAMLCGFSFFWYGINIRAHRDAPLLLAPVVMVVAYAATPWLGIVTTFGNQERGSAMVVLSVGIAAFYLVGKDRDLTLQISRTKRAVFLLLCLALIWFLYQAGMRSAMAGLVIGLALFIVANAPTRELKIMTVMALAVVVMMIVSSVRPIFPSYFTLDAERPAIWAEALRLAQGEPLGIGLGQWRIYALAWINIPDLGAGYWRELHNDYLQLLVEAGPLALAAWCYLLWRVIFPVPSGARGLLAIGLIAVTVNAFFLFPFQLPVEAAWFWLVAGVYTGTKAER